jgi:maltooligosyltrehalose trehalohydrolase
MEETAARRMPIGAEFLPGVGVHFRVWAPDRARVEVVFEEGEAPGSPLEPEHGGYHSGRVGGVGPGARYRFRLDGEGPFPDPASRFQPEGPHGPSEVIDPDAFPWADSGWPGIDPEGQVLYELHVSTFTEAGTWEAAAEGLPTLAELGITAVELMPVADFPGRFGWGYDGVDFFAPTRLYGRPEGMKRFIDRAHALGLGVILDVVYNHFGPDGNYLPAFSPDYLSKRHTTDWGDGLNFDGERSGPVREFVLANVAYWIDEFHLDGLRVDATQDINDDSPEHVLAAITRTARKAAGGRRVLLVAENEPQDARLLRPIEQGGYGFDMAWSDDFHHTALVALTGRNDAYYADYLGSSQEFVSALKRGWLYQGQRDVRQDKRRGSPGFDRSPWQFVFFLQNHDQLANSMRGDRLPLLCGPGRYRAMTALWLLAPQTPMFFQGQEYASTRPFLYFMDHTPELAEAVRRGHDAFLMQFDDLALPEIQARLPDPGDPATFTRCKLDPSERHRHPHHDALHRDLLRLRRSEPALKGPVDGADRYFVPGGDDRLLVVNLGRALHLDPVPEPLLAPPGGTGWAIRWSSEAPEYGGTGTPGLEAGDGWHLPGHAAVFLHPRADAEDPARPQTPETTDGP